MKVIAAYIAGIWLALLALTVDASPRPATADVDEVDLLLVSIDQDDGNDDSVEALAQRLPEVLPRLIDHYARHPGLSNSPADRVLAAAIAARWNRNIELTERESAILAALTAAAVDDQTPPARRVLATDLLRMLLPLRHYDLSALTVNLEASDTALRQITRDTLERQGHPAVLGALIEGCRAAMNEQSPAVGEKRSRRLEGCLDPLARIGSQARAALPLLLEWLTIGNGDDRTQILATLGYLDDQSALPALLDGLKSRDDREVTASLESIWRLQAQAALPAIDPLSRGHWFSPVRAFAGQIAIALRTGMDAPLQKTLTGFDRRYSESGRHLSGLPLYWGDSAPAACYGQKGTRDALMHEMFESEIPVDPRLGVRLADVENLVDAREFAGGLLYGFDKGEFGGGLGFQSANGQRTQLSTANVTGLLSAGPERMIAVTGLAHMSDPGGWLLLVEADAQHDVKITQRVRLPSAPQHLLNAGKPNSAGAWRIRLAVGIEVLVAPDLGLTEGTCVAAPAATTE